jgi:hypothetical protein
MPRVFPVWSRARRSAGDTGWPADEHQADSDAQAEGEEDDETARKLIAELPRSG